MTSLRVLTYNIHSCKGFDGKFHPQRIADVIRPVNPDLVALQEVDVGRHRSGGVNQPAAIGELLGMNHYFAPRWDVDGGQYGLGILSRYPMTLQKAAPLTKEPRERTRDKMIGFWMSLKIDQQEIQFINTHFVHDFRITKEATRTLMGPEWIGHTSARSPVILCGDFNSTFLSPIYWRLTRSLRSAKWRAENNNYLKGLFQNSWPSPFPFVQIDYIFVSRNIHVSEFGVVKNSLAKKASDHLPVFASIELSGDRSS